MTAWSCPGRFEVGPIYIHIHTHSGVMKQIELPIEFVAVPVISRT